MFFYLCTYICFCFQEATEPIQTIGSGAKVTTNDNPLCFLCREISGSLCLFYLAFLIALQHSMFTLNNNLVPCHLYHGICFSIGIYQYPWIRLIIFLALSISKPKCLIKEILFIQINMHTIRDYGVFLLWRFCMTLVDFVLFS